jgi:prepilin-type N-terminal cleavage/methylation domain-containing protein
MRQDSRFKNKYASSRGFTLVELIVCISIFAMMTALVVAKYGNFNQSVLLTNLAYDMALTIRTAQTYGVSVRQAGTGNFTYPYGVYFSSVSGNNTSFVFFTDMNLDVNDQGYYDVADQIINTYTLKRGAKIQQICTDDTCISTEDELHITFKRPDPDARFCVTSTCGVMGAPAETYVKIVIEGTDGSTRAVVVRKNGQISVED